MQIENFEKELEDLLSKLDSCNSHRDMALGTKALLIAGCERIFAMAGREGQGLACHSILGLMQKNIEFMNDNYFDGNKNYEN